MRQRKSLSASLSVSACMCGNAERGDVTSGNVTACQRHNMHLGFVLLSLTPKYVPRDMGKVVSSFLSLNLLSREKAQKPDFLHPINNDVWQNFRGLRTGLFFL